MTFNLRIVLAALFCLMCAPAANAFTTTLQPAQWYLLSMPGDSDQTIAQLFEGELDPAGFPGSWSVFPIDQQSQEYRTLGLNSRLNPGEAFWFAHTNDGPIDLEIDLTVRTVPLTLPVTCSSPIGCFEFDLPSGPDIRWSLIGTPFPEGVLVSDIRLVTESGPCVAGCTMQEGISEDLVGGTFYQLDDTNESGYRTLSPDDYLEAGVGYWFASAIGTNAGQASLLFPTFCTPFN